MPTKNRNIRELRKIPQGLYDDIWLKYTFSGVVQKTPEWKALRRRERDGCCCLVSIQPCNSLHISTPYPTQMLSASRPVPWRQPVRSAKMQ
jgi:hypothetical protein